MKWNDSSQNKKCKWPTYILFKTCSLSQVISKIQVKFSLRFYLTPVRMGCHQEIWQGAGKTAQWLRKLCITGNEIGKIIFLKEKHTNWLPNTKWSVLETLHVMKGFIYVFSNLQKYVFVHLHTLVCI